MNKLGYVPENLLYKLMDTPVVVKGSAFDYLKDPLEVNNFRALLRMWDLIPLIGQLILAEMQDRLEDKGMFVHTIKVDFPKIFKLLSDKSRNAIKRYKEDELEHNTNTVLGEYHLQLKIVDDFCRNVLPYLPEDTRTLYKGTDFKTVMSRGKVRAFVRKYVSVLGIIEGAINTSDLISYKRDVIDKCIPMGQLEVGQEFMFPYAEHAMDDGGQCFTYLGLVEYPQKNESSKIVAQYRKLSDNIHVVYEEENALRAVLPVT